MSYWQYQIDSQTPEKNKQIKDILVQNGYHLVYPGDPEFYRFILITEDNGINGNHSHQLGYGKLITWEEFQRTVLKMNNMNKFKVGDKVTVKFYDFTQNGKIKHVFPDDFYLVEFNKSFQLKDFNMSSSNFLFSGDQITLATESFKLAGHEATTDGNSLTVGCTTLTFEQVESTYRKMLKLKTNN